MVEFSTYHAYKILPPDLYCTAFYTDNTWYKSELDAYIHYRHIYQLRSKFKQIILNLCCNNTLRTEPIWFETRHAVKFFQAMHISQTNFILNKTHLISFNVAVKVVLIKLFLQIKFWKQYFTGCVPYLDDIIDLCMRQFNDLYQYVYLHDHFSGIFPAGNWWWYRWCQWRGWWQSGTHRLYWARWTQKRLGTSWVWWTIHTAETGRSQLGSWWQIRKLGCQTPAEWQYSTMLVPGSYTVDIKYQISLWPNQNIFCSIGWFACFFSVISQCDKLIIH